MGTLSFFFLGIVQRFNDGRHFLITEVFIQNVSLGSLKATRVYFGGVQQQTNFIH
jgi:hypothetical protein